MFISNHRIEIYLDLPNIRFYSIPENPHIFLNPDLTVEDRDTLESIFLCREKLLNEIKVCPTFFVSIFNISQNVKHYNY